MNNDFNQPNNAEDKTLRTLLVDYRAGYISLNQFIQRIEYLRVILNSDELKEQLYLVILELEQINAIALSENRSISEYEKEYINNVVKQLDKINL